MDVRTDGQIPPVFYRTSSPSGPLPKKKKKKKKRKKKKMIINFLTIEKATGLKSLVRYICLKTDEVSEKIERMRERKTKKNDLFRYLRKGGKKIVKERKKRKREKVEKS